MTILDLFGVKDTQLCARPGEVSTRASKVDLLTPLKQYFGYSSFRPLQEQIIRTAIDGKDVLAVLPTGGGKSLCFQLPALIRPGLTVVVSPLIALMKDQVDSMIEAGVAATFLNSSLESEESRERVIGLFRGEFKLLYVAPERLVMPEFVSLLVKWKVSAIAVDEAHCISDWGHDFRPEYRALSNIRKALPDIPFMALTATATERVRSDIVNQLGFAQAETFVASFNRPNLFYRVLPKVDTRQELLKFVKEHKDESGIIYCHSRKGAEAIAEFLRDNKVSAKPYHAGLTGNQREKYQDMFIADKIDVICATVAFGMGINKPDVRYVVHYDLPKNIESYYQETGRAGRDGLPAQCLLFFSAGDAAKYASFIDEKQDENEQRVARQQLSKMVSFAESHLCRRTELLHYFGEQYEENTCDNCDNCLFPRQMVDGTIEMQKFLSCIMRVQKKSNFSVGVAHIAEVLTGGVGEKVKKWGHDELSTWGIGKEHSRKQWMSIGRELLRLGLIEQRADRFNVLEVTEDGKRLLKAGGSVKLSEFLMQQDEQKVKAKAKEKVQKESGPFDQDLFERLRGLRREIADEKRVPAYLVFGDTALQDMARKRPRTKEDFMQCNGVGEKKLRAYGPAFLHEINRD